MYRHRQKLDEYLDSALKHDEDAVEIKSRLLNGGGYERSSRDGGGFEQAAAVKFKRKWVMEYIETVEKTVNTPARCAQMKAQGGCSGKGWDRLRAVASKNWKTSSNTYEPIVIDIGVEGQEGVRVPKQKCDQTLKSKQEKYCRTLGVRNISDDGSGVAMYTVVGAISRQCIEAGWNWCLNRLVEVLYGGDAHRTRKKLNMCHITLKVIGATDNDNSPASLWGLSHWQGKDDWGSLNRYCQHIFDAIRLLEQTGYVVVDFGSGGKKREMKVKIDQFLCADGAFLDAEEGGSGFCVEESCVKCRCNKTDFGDSEHKSDWPKKTATYLAHSSHMPLNGNFKIKCPHRKCNFSCTNKSQWETERTRLAALSKSGVTTFKSEHSGQRPLLFKLFPLPIDKTIPDTMHYLMGVIGHQWKHGVALYIDDKDMATEVNEKLHQKCGVVVTLSSVSKTPSIDAARLPSLPGKQSLKVVEYFDLFLEIVCHWGGRNSGGTCVVRKNKQKAIAANDALLALWNEMMEPMECENGKIPTTEERNYKADLIGEMVRDWRDAYTHAYGKKAAKPYTHMALHFEECQRRLQHDLVRYSCQAQEHYGKIAKSIVRLRTNGLLGKCVRRWKRKRVHKKGDELECTRSTTISKGYVRQFVEEVAHGRELRRLVPVKPTAYNGMMSKKRQRTTRATSTSNSARFVKAEDWKEHTEVDSEKIPMYIGK